MLEMRNIIHKQTTSSRRGDFQQKKQNNVIETNWLKRDLCCGVGCERLPTVDLRMQKSAGDLHSHTFDFNKRGVRSLLQSRECSKTLDWYSQEGLS